MIDKRHRFQGYGSLRFVYQKGQTLRGPLCALKFSYNKRRDAFRVAVVVSKKVHKSAVVRNRIRRRIYEAVRLLAPKIKKPYDLVFMVYSDQLASMPAEHLRRCVEEKLYRSNVLEKSEDSNASAHDIVNTKEL